MVTGEHPSVNQPTANPTNQRKLKIPNVCKEVQVEWMGIPDMVKEEQWTF